MGAIDYTKLLAKLMPEPGGEDVLRLRVGTIDTFNLDGTADVAISGVVVPDVPRLSSTALAPGDVVQVLSYRGSLMILGAVGGDGGGWVAGGGITANATVTGGEASRITAKDINGATPTFKPGRVYRVVSAVSAARSGATDPLMRIRKTNNVGTQIDSWRATPNGTGTSVSANAPRISYFKVLNTAVTADIVLTITAAASETVTLTADANSPGSINIYDDGPASSGTRTWVLTLT